MCLMQLRLPGMMLMPFISGFPLNWMPDGFLTKDKSNIICSSHGALYEIDSGLCVAGPCMGKKLHPVEVRVEKGEIIVRGPTGLR